VPYGMTPLNQRLLMTPSMYSRKKNKKTVFLLSDGMDSCDESLDLCGTSSYLNDQGIDFNVFSFILETEDNLSIYAYEIYKCLVQQSNGKLFHVDKKGDIQETEIEKLKGELKLVLPHFVKSHAWRGYDNLYQFDINSMFDHAEIEEDNTSGQGE